MSEKTLTAKQIAERYGVAPSTARAWCLNGTLPGAYLKETELGSFWVVPESRLAHFEPPKPGPKPADTAKRATGQKNASNGPSSKKKGNKK
jgi:hypothetical protein